MAVVERSVGSSCAPEEQPLWGGHRGPDLGNVASFSMADVSSLLR